MIGCLLWDFGDTLCDELSLFRHSPEWMEVYESSGTEGGLGAAWSLGESDAREMAARLATRMSLSSEEILAHFSRVDLFDFFPTAYAYFRARHVPQAIVTVNPAIFRQMAAQLGLDEFVDTIVISGEEGTADKGVLCEVALERMPIACPNEEALLIDNSQVNLQAWARKGGPGYLFTTDQRFARDSAEGILGLLG